MKIAKTCLIVVLICAVSDIRAQDQNSSANSADGSLVGNNAGQVREDNGLAMKFVWCPPGDLTMEQVEVLKQVEQGPDGKQDTRRVEKSVPIRVSLSRGFWIGRCEVTQAEWERVMEATPWNDFQRSIPTQNDLPATCINWFDAMEFCGKLNRQERAAGRLPAGWEYTLPTEAAWEYACRAGTETRFNFGDDESVIGESAWFYDNTSDKREAYAHQVGRKRPNAWGLCDMHGNACEWCRDFYAQKLPGGVDPYAASEGWSRVIRGGCFNHRPNGCRSACREGLSPIPRGNCIGFRVALCAGDADLTAATVQKLKQTIPILVETERSGPALTPAGRKAGAFPGDEPDVVEALVKIKSLGGQVRRNFGRPDAPITGVELAFSNHLCDDDLELLKPLKSVREVGVAYTSVTDACLDQIACLPELRVLNLGATKVTDAGMQLLRRFPDLQGLYLFDTSVGDDGLTHVAELTKMKSLVLMETPITDAGLKRLAKLDSLTELNLQGTNVSQAAQDELKAALPNLIIVPPKPENVEKTPDVSPLVGTTSANWTAADLAGKDHSLEEYRGKVLVLDFWFRRCPWCLRAMPQVKAVARHFENQPVVVIGMSTDEEEEDAAAVVEKMELKYPVLKASEVSNQYEIDGFPTLLIIDQQGVIRKVHVGYSATLKEEIIEIVDGLLTKRD